MKEYEGIYMAVVESMRFRTHLYALHSTADCYCANSGGNSPKIHP